DAERQATALMDRRDELRGLLEAYQARAAKLGRAEDSELDARYDRARDLLWTAPCDLSAAPAAATGYQQAVLALSGRTIREWRPSRPDAPGRAAAGRSRAGTATPAGWPPCPASRRRASRRRPGPGQARSRPPSPGRPAARGRAAAGRSRAGTATP